MSIEATNWAYRTFKIVDLPTADRIVLLVLCHSHNKKDNKCFPSHDTIAEATGLSRTRVKYAIRTLSALNLISVERRMPNGRQSSNQYVLFGKLKVKIDVASGGHLSPPHRGARPDPLKSREVTPIRKVLIDIGRSSCGNIVKFPVQKSDGGDV
jgi:DNA-binding transcriptional MocR family regulator